MRLRCGETFNNHGIANFSQSVAVKDFLLNQPIFAQDMDSDKVRRFLKHNVE